MTADITPDIAPKITVASAELWRFPLATAMGGSGLTVVDLIVVDLETSDGARGTGFSYVLGGGGGAVHLLAGDMLERLVRDQPVRPPQALWRRLAGSLNRLGRGAGYLAIAAIDVAAWDLAARRQGVPLYTALGGEARKLPVYGSAGFRPLQAPEEAAARATEYAAMGCSAVKLRLSGSHHDVALLRAVSDVLPEGVHLMADANERCDLARAKWLASQCAEFDALWLEEPLPAYDADGYAALAAASPVAIAAGEHLQGAGELAPYLAAKSIAVVQPDLAMMGGITECLRTAEFAAHHGLVVAPHFLPALFVHVAAAAPAMQWLEHFPLIEPLFAAPVEMDEAGQMMPPEIPGHGLVWADGAREEYRIAG